MTISAAAVAGALDDRVELLLRGPAHLDQVGQRDAGDRRIAGQRHHGVAVAAEHEGGDVLDRDLEFLGQEQAEARAVEHARHADDLVGRQAGDFLHHPDHGVERVGDDDDEGVGRVLLDALADRVDDPGIDADQIVARHAGLAREAGGDDHDVGAGDVRVVRRARVVGVEALDRRELRDVERLALGRALGRGTSNRTTSPSSFRPASRASVPPICPAPISAIFLRAMRNSPDSEGGAW